MPVFLFRAHIKWLKTAVDGGRQTYDEENKFGGEDTP